jgi:hypothetical protein
MILSLGLINFSKKHFKFSQEKKSKKIKEKVKKKKIFRLKIINPKKKEKIIKLI